MKKALLRLPVLTLATLLTSLFPCSSMGKENRFSEFTPTLLHFDLPETKGKLLRGDIDFRLSYGPRFTLADGDHFSTDEIHTTNAIDETSDSGAGLTIGLLPNVDIFARGYSQSVSVAGVKIQLIGTPQIQQEKGLKASLAVEFGDTQNSDSPTSNGGIHADTKARMRGISFNIGHRESKTEIVYLNTFYLRYATDGDIYVGDALYRSENDRGHLFGVTAGINRGDPTWGRHTTFELGVVQSQWPDTGRTFHFPVGISIGWSW